MSMIKRISTTLFSRLDHVVGEIENHDALIKVTIAEQKKKLAAAKVQLSKIHTSEKRVKEQLAQNAIAIRKWEQRAIAEAETHEEKALQCLQRKKQIQQQEYQLKEMLVEYKQTAQKIAADIERCEQEVQSMIQKHELMRARQSSVDAMAVISEAGSSHLDDLQNSFDRWEVKISQGEMFSTQLDNVDLLEQEYIAQENDMELKQELALLLHDEKAKD